VIARIVVSFLLVTAPVVSSAPRDTVRGAGTFRPDFDYARFYGNDSLTYVEIYYSVPQQMLTFQEKNDRLLAGINMYVTVLKDGKTVGEKEWTTPCSVEDSTSLARRQNIIGLTTFALGKGDYECSVRSYDFFDSTRSDTSRFPIHVATFNTARGALSDIELCSSIRQEATERENVFFKNTLEVLPNVGGIYGANLPVLFYYVEGYNLLAVKSEYYAVRVVVSDATGEEVLRTDRLKKRANNTSVEVGTLNVHALEGGTYGISVSLVDTSAGWQISSSRKFFVYKAGMNMAGPSRGVSGDVSASEFAVMQEDELDRDFAQGRYVATAAEIRQYGQFTSLSEVKARLNAKRTFLFEFWRKRDPDPGNPGNPMRQEYLRRVDAVNEKFSSGFKSGWETERGRVYLVYGAPDEIERFPNSSDTRPFEIWHFNEIQGGVIFVFVDRSGFGDWILVHSTHRNEIHDRSWEQYLKK